MRKRRFKKRGRSQQSRVYGFLALHTNFQALRKVEVRRMPRMRTSRRRSSKKFGHKKSPRGKPLSGLRYPTHRTLRLRHERGRYPTEGLKAATAGATRNDTYGT